MWATPPRHVLDSDDEPAPRDAFFRGGRRHAFGADPAFGFAVRQPHAELRLVTAVARRIERGIERRARRGRIFARDRSEEVIERGLRLGPQAPKCQRARVAPELPAVDR